MRGGAAAIRFGDALGNGAGDLLLAGLRTGAQSNRQSADPGIVTDDAGDGADSSVAAGDCGSDAGR